VIICYYLYSSPAFLGAIGSLLGTQPPSGKELVQLKATATSVAAIAARCQRRGLIFLKRKGSAQFSRMLE
jgi:hypothetical protein